MKAFDRFLAALVALLFSILPVSAEQVLVSRPDAPEGTGVLVWLSDVEVCAVLTAAHVACEDVRICPMEGVRASLRGQGYTFERYQPFEKHDLILLTPSDNPALSCSQNLYTLEERIDLHLYRNFSGRIRYQREFEAEDGTAGGIDQRTVNIPVEICSYNEDYIFLRSIGQERLQVGMSGAALTLGDSDVLAGILVAVQAGDDAPACGSRAVRIEVLNDRLLNNAASLGPFTVVLSVDEVERFPPDNSYGLELLDVPSSNLFDVAFVDVAQRSQRIRLSGSDPEVRYSLQRCFRVQYIGTRPDGNFYEFEFEFLDEEVGCR